MLKAASSAYLEEQPQIKSNTFIPGVKRFQSSPARDFCNPKSVVGNMITQGNTPLVLWVTFTSECRDSLAAILICYYVIPLIPTACKSCTDSILFLHHNPLTIARSISLFQYKGIQLYPDVTDRTLTLRPQYDQLSNEMTVMLFTIHYILYLVIISD